MRAYVCPSYGPPEVLRLTEVPRPAPDHHEVLIKVCATAVTASDIFIRGSELPLRYRIPMRLMIGLTKPRKSIIGLVLAGEVEAAGRDTRRFAAGDLVYGITCFGLGAYAEYTCMPETDSNRCGCLAKMPANVTFEEATAAAYGGLLALQYLEKGGVRRGRRVLVYGASGTTGTTAVQYARHLGAHVTAVCGTANLGLVAALGADRVLDYTTRDAPDPGDRYDLVLDAVGRHKTSPLKQACRRALAPGGTYVSIDDGRLLPDSARLEKMRQLVEAGHIRPVLDSCYPFEQLAEAHRYVALGHKRGGVAVTVA